ncbi:MAG TPA: CIA30 family protein [Thermoanaerobaculia bacterium]|nr:CIA30 family protein [Thermoanaerobaculia bacterium]
MRTLLALLFLLTLPLQAADVLFRGARVFDGVRVLDNTDVLVRNGRIESVGRKLQAPEGAEVIDASGKTLLPGLIDAHSHAFGDVLRDALMFGVTTELDMFSDPESAQKLRAEQKAGNVAGRADLFSASILVTAPGGHGTEYGFVIPTITSPDQAQAFVDARIAEGSDWIKIVYDDGKAYGIGWPTLSVETMRAVIAAAHKRGKLAVVHIGAADDAKTAIEAGADALVHLFTDKPASADFAQVVKKHRAFIIPTLVVLRSITGTPGAGEVLKDPRLEPYISISARGTLQQAFPVRPNAKPRDFGVAKETVRRLKAAGVPILAGTDAPNAGTAHGVAMHRELELLVESGLTPVEALAAATSVPAKSFGLADRGRIEKGRRADLLLVQGDPTTDITATRAIEGVWKGGVRADRAAFAKEVVIAAKATTVDVGSGLISDFESGKPSASFGSEWFVSTDSMASGKSTGTIEVASGVLRVKGKIDPAIPYAWAGAMWSPAAVPMTPANLSATKGLRFRARGDGGTYRVLVFAQSKGMFPLTRTFVAGPEWRDESFPWSAFGGIDGHDIMAVLFCGGPQPGDFSFEVDDVRLEK